MAKNFPKLMTDRHQTRSRKLRERHQNKYRKAMPWYIVFKLQKTKDNKKILKEARKKKHLT